MPNPCLSCSLADCDETDPKCVLKPKLISERKKWYIKLKKDPVRYAKYLKDKNAGRRKLYHSSPKTKVSRNASATKWQKENPEKMRRIWRRYHENNKEKRLAQAREYKKKRRTE